MTAPRTLLSMVGVASAHPSPFDRAALVIVGAIGAYFWEGLPGYDALAFIGVIACAGYAMFRVWRDRHTYT